MGDELSEAFGKGAGDGGGTLGDSACAEGGEEVAGEEEEGDGEPEGGEEGG